MANFDPQHKAIPDDLLLIHPNVAPGKICLYDQGVGIRLSEQSAAKLLKTDRSIVPFQPGGRRKSSERVQVNLTRSQDHRQYQAAFDESIRHVPASQ